MNIVLWILAGGVLGWAGFAYLKFNEDRGLMISAIIGAAGGLLGGKIIAPMFLEAAKVPADFSMPALFFAAAVASGFLYLGNMVSNRWGV
jgi:uncharacterized membrane protein YeaQ/YmgE (transglycosylase-associated protein family)